MAAGAPAPGRRSRGAALSAAARPGGATALSHHAAPGRTKFLGISLLARGSLGGIGVLAAGCLADPPPDFDPVEKTPPILLLEGAKPRVSDLLRDRPGDTISFVVPFRSDDAGEDLLGVLHLDFGTTASTFLQSSARLPGGVLADTDRSVEITWRVPANLSGCHSLTLLVTHIGNLDFSTQRPLDADDVGRVTWWIDVGGSGASTLTCPGGAT